MYVPIAKVAGEGITPRTLGYEVGSPELDKVRSG